MRKLFGTKKNDHLTSRHSIKNPEVVRTAHPGNAFPAIPQASQAATQGNQAAAQASQVRPGEPFRSQGDELARNNDYNGAVVMYDAALRCAPNDLSLLLSRSMAYSMSEPPRLDLALKDADCVIQLDPNWWQGWLQKGQILLQRGDLQSAEEALTNATGFAQDFDRNTAQRALADVRVRRAQAPATASLPAIEMFASDQSNLPLRPASTTSPLPSSASGIASTTLTTSPPSTAPSATFNPLSTAHANLGPTTAPSGGTTTKPLPPTRTSTSAS